MNHHQHLKKLLTFLVKAPQQNTLDMSEGNFIRRAIPKEILLQNKDKELQLNALMLTVEEYDLFHKSVENLRKDIKTEHLDYNEIKNAIWYLVCEVWCNRKKYRDTKELNKKIANFVESVCKPLEEYEVIFKINNLEIKRKTKIWDCWITTYSKGTLKRKGFKSPYESLSQKISGFENRCVIVFNELGNNEKLAAHRARLKANEIIKLLQAYLSSIPLIHNDQLLFTLSEDYIVREKRVSKFSSSGSYPNIYPSRFNYDNDFRMSSKKVNNHYKILSLTSEKLQNRVKRAIVWIGKAVAEIDYDLKIAFLCTALETLLTTIADKRKGEKIAYRVVLLQMEFKTELIHPKYILNLYLTRNDVVHGSKIGIASKQEYNSLLEITTEALYNFIEFTHKKKLKNQNDVLMLITKSKHTPKFLKKLNQFSDKSSEHIIEAVREDLKNLNSLH